MMKFQEKINKNRILNLITQQPYSIKFFCMSRIHLSVSIYYSSPRMKMLARDTMNPKVFTEYLEDMSDVYKTIKDYNPERKRKVLIVFNDIIVNRIVIKTSSSRY